MKMKGTFGFLMLIFTALMLLTVIGGMSTIFTSIASTWTTNQTAKIADGLAQVLWYFGIVFVSVLGFVLYNAASRGGGSRRPQEQREPQYTLTDGLPTSAQPKLLTADTDADWYEIETPRQQRQLA